MDLIDERNRREKIARSIIKRQQINYISPEEIEKKKLEEEKAKKAQEVLEHLREVAEKSEEELRREIEEVRRRQEKRDLYNSATGSYSGEYGKDDIIDDVSKMQIERILKERSEALYQVIDKIKKEDLE